MRCNPSKPRGSGPAQSDCSASVGCCYCSPTESASERKKKGFSVGMTISVPSSLCRSISHPETAFILLCALCALSKGLVQTNRKEACRFPLCLVEVCTNMVMGEELMLTIVLRFRVVMTFGEMAGSLFLGVPGRPAPASVTVRDCDTKVL